MFAGGEEMMRVVRDDCVQILCKLGRHRIPGPSGRYIQLGLVHLKSIDLLMIQFPGPDHILWSKARSGGISQSGISSYRPISPEPGSDCSIGHSQAPSSSKACLGLTQGVAEMVVGNSLKDMLERIGPVSARSICELI